MTEPAFPSTGNNDPSTGQRVLTGLQEMVRAFSSGSFIRRLTSDNISLLRDGDLGAIKWGSMNRLLLMADVAIQLPRIEPRYIGVPLEFILLETGNVATLVPTGLGMNRRDRPLVNGAATLAKNTLGLYSLRTDGQNWFTAP